MAAEQTPAAAPATSTQSTPNGTAQAEPKFMTTKEALKASRQGKLDPDGFGGKGTYDPSMDRGKWGGNPDGDPNMGLDGGLEELDLGSDGQPRDEDGRFTADGEVLGDDEQLAEGDEIVEEPAADDSGLPPELAEFADGLHGVPLQELLESLRDGVIPEALLGKLEIEMSDGSKKWKEPLEKVKGERMMREKFSQLTQQLSSERKAFEAERAQHTEQKDDLIDFMRTWKDPDTLMDSLLDFGLPVDQMLRNYNGRLEKVNALYALEQEGKLPPGSAKEAWEKYETDRKLKRAEYDSTVREKKAAKAQESQHNTKLLGAVQKAGGAMLKQLGADPTDAAQWNLFKRNLVDHLQREKKKVPGKSDVLKAAQAAKAEYDEILASHQKRSSGKPASLQQRAAAAGKGAPRGADPRAPKLDASTRKGGAPKPMTTKDFLKKNQKEFLRGR